MIPQNSNRSFPPPHAPWSFRQTWRDILFAHWRLPAAQLQLLLPRRMQLDTFDGHAWLSVVALRVTDSAPRFVTAVPWLSSFYEVNLRTYITYEGRPAIYFLSLDASQPFVVRLARASVGLAYFDANIEMSRSDESIFVQSIRKDRRAPRAIFAATYRLQEGTFRPTFGTLASWLTDRYCSYSVRGRSIVREETHHAPWLLAPVRLDIHENSLFEAFGIDVSGPPDLVHFSRRQDTLLWLPSFASVERYPWQASD